MNKVIFGIDLGTCYSCIARVDEFGQPVVLQNIEGQMTTPSVVYFESDSNFVVGEIAKESFPLFPDRVVSLFKQSMGDEHWRFKFGEKEYNAIELSSMVLKKLAADAKVATGIDVEEVVITCPAYFGVGQKAATEQAGILAGLKVRAVIPEPTAAAVAYGMRSDNEEVVLVFDLGGGTFDVTLIDIKKNKLTVLTTGGDAKLGGGLWDVELARLMAQRLSDQIGQPAEAIESDKEFYPQLLQDAEKTKRSLTSRESTKQSETFGGERATLEITREEFNSITAALLERTITLTNETLDAAEKAGHPKPTRICLVGGSSFMKQVKLRLQQEFPDLEINLEDPNQIVAKGAAQFGFITMVQDAVLELVEKNSGGKIDEIANAKPSEIADAAKQLSAKLGMAPSLVQAVATREVTNVTSRGFGIRVQMPDKTFRISNLVHLDNQVPVDTTKPFSTIDEGQSSVEIAIFETEQRTTDASPLVDENSCKQLAVGELDLGNGFPAGEPIEVTFGLSKDGTLAIEAMHLRTGRKLPLNIKVEGVMDDVQFKQSEKKVGSLTLAN